MQEIFYIIQGRKVTANGKDLGPAEDSGIAAEGQESQVQQTTEQQDSLQAQAETARTEAEGMIADLTTERDGLKVQLGELQGRFDTEQRQFENTREGYAAFSTQYDTEKAQWAAERDQAKTRVDRLTAQAQSQDTALAERVAQLDQTKARAEKAEGDLATVRTELETMTGYRDLAAKDANERQARITELETQLAALQAPAPTEAPADPPADPAPITGKTKK